MSSTLSAPPRRAVTDPATQGRRRSEATSLLTLPELRWAGLATGLFAVGAVLQVSGAPAWSWWALYLACYASGGWEPGLAGVRAARARTLDVDLLMIVAAVVAAGIGQVFDGALLIVIFATSGALEAVATKRTADSVRALLDIAPEQATRLGRDGVEDLVDTADLLPGEVVLVRPGERVGADGVVVGGASEVDQASITGEPLPVLKDTGAEVFAGTMNGTGALTVRVSRPASDSVVARIVTLVEEASATKAKTQLFIEQIEQRYSTGVVAATVALFLLPLAFGADLRTTLLRAMTFMIVASPCAVVLATMPPLLSSIANAGRHGVLVKSAVVMEQLGVVDLVAFDKTGTLTEGTPRVAEIHPLPRSGLGVDDLLGFAAAAERPSEHPLATAITAAAHDRGVPVGNVADFTSTPGRGVAGRVAGHHVRVGSPALLADATDRTPAGTADTSAVIAADGAAVVADGAAAVAADAAGVIAAAEADGRTAVLVLLDGRPAGVLALADRVRPDAAATVAALTALTGHVPVLLTGDNPGAAARLAEEVAITDVHAGLLPADKVARVDTLQADGRRVLLVGDGVNDAPALAAAHLGLAMGGHGSDLALQTADAVLVRDDLAAAAKVIDLSRRARRVVTANLAIAGSVITALVVWDLAGHLPLPLGVAGHEGSTVIVGLNGLRLLRSSVWERAASTR